MDDTAAIFEHHVKAHASLSTRTFWPDSGWFHLRGGNWARLYVCADRLILRRAVCVCKNNRWQFEVREHVRGCSSVLVARQSMSMGCRHITSCWHAADLAACQQYQEGNHENKEVCQRQLPSQVNVRPVSSGAEPRGGQRSNREVRPIQLQKRALLRVPC